MTSSSTALPNQPSTSLTATELVPPECEHTSGGRTNGILRLRGAHTERRRVTWTEEVVDNEGLGRKKTKICCIYNKPREFGESSSEESDSSSSSDEGEGSKNPGDNSPSGGNHPSENQHKGHTCQNHKGKGQRRKNAYEKTPNRQKSNP